jgi:hypothetical protein
LAAAHEPQVSAVLARQERGDEPALAVPADGDDDGRVSPLHQAL